MHVDQSLLLFHCIDDNGRQSEEELVSM